MTEVREGGGGLVGFEGGGGRKGAVGPPRACVCYLSPDGSVNDFPTTRRGLYIRNLAKNHDNLDI